tara:strand:- start:1016 stop:3037 length:2022 start_codon:yes stop_codon:yes gene_type:complete
MTTSAISQFIGSVLAEKAGGVKPTVDRPKVARPNPYDDTRMDISDRFRPLEQYGSSASASVSSRGDSSGPGPYRGPLDVMGMTQPVANQFVGAPRGLSAAMAPVGFSTFMGLGSAISLKNLQRIENKIAEGEAGYALGMFNNRIIGVSPGLLGGHSLSGVLPEGLTHKQRSQLISNLLSLREAQDNPKDFAVAPQPTIEPTDEERAAAGQANVVFDSQGNPVRQSSPFERENNKIVTTEAGRYTSQAELERQAAAKQAADEAAAAAARRNQSDDDDDSGFDYDNFDYDDDSAGFDYSGFFKKGGRVDMADGGSADPVQGNGFVEGSPDNYTKSQTVADDENRQVREGSFVINAPTVEKLQQAGMLPKGVDNSNKNATIKANKGGLMDVALSKGEYVIEPEEAQRIGYSFLEKINDQGKAEVDRRQAVADGGFIDGYQEGGITLPVPSPVRQRATQEEDIPLPEIPDSFRKKLITFMKPIVDRDKKPNRTQINNFIKSLNPKEQLAFVFLTETTSNAAPLIEMENIGEVILNRIESNYRDFSKLTNQQQVLLQHVNNDPKKAKQFSGLEPTIVFERSKDVIKGLAEPGLRKAYAASENVLSDDPDRASLRRLPYATVFYTKKDADSQWMRKSKDLEYAGEEGGHEFYRPASISVSDAQKAAEKYRYTNINPEFP